MFAKCPPERHLWTASAQDLKLLPARFPAENMLRLGYERPAEALEREQRLGEALNFAEFALARSPFSASASRKLG
jgi:hypothetical protein